MHASVSHIFHVHRCTCYLIDAALSTGYGARVFSEITMKMWCLIDINMLDRCKVMVKIPCRQGCGA